MVNSAFRSDANLAEALAARARTRSDGRLVLDVIGGVAAASALGIWRPAFWILPFCAAICFTSFGVWGIADREIRERANGPRASLVRLLVAMRMLSALIGAVAVVTAIFATLAATLGTWIS
ncbi:MAG: hypothetical protein ABJE10_16925 [bacterium]